MNSLKQLAKFSQPCYRALLFLAYCSCNLVATASAQGFTENEAFYLRIFDDLNIPTGFILNQAFLDHEELEDFYLPPGIELADRNIKTSYGSWQQIYRKMRVAGTDYVFDSQGAIVDQFYPTLIPPLSAIVPSQARTNPEAPIGILFIDANYVHADSLLNNLNADSTSLLPETPIETVNILNISNLRTRVFSPNVLFSIDTALIFSNRDDILGLNIDFSDGTGMHSFDIENQTISISYETFGEKSIYFELITATDTLLCTSEIQVYPALQADFEEHLVVNTSMGITTGVDIQAFLGCDGVLDRPVMALGGFEVLQKSDPFDRYLRYYQTGLAPYLGGQGYDFIAIGLDNTHLSMKVNAEVLQAVIEYVNSRKSGHFENVLIGESMGGVVSRICLKQMEDQNIDHQVRLYVSFDAPHKGANTPLSVQETMHDILNADASSIFASILGGFIGNLVGGFAGSIVGSIAAEEFTTSIIEDAIQDGVNDQLGEQTLEDLDRALRAASSQEMGIRNKFAEAEDLTSDFDTINPIYLEFQSFLDALGFPQNCRNITLINGSNTAKPQTIEKFVNGVFTEVPLMEGDSIINIKERNVLTYALISFTHAINVQVSAISRRKNRFFFNIQEKGFFSFGCRSFDTSPGSTPTDGYVFSFIPTASGIALSTALFETPDGLFIFNENDDEPGLTREELILNALVPFDDIYGQAANTPHLLYSFLSPDVRSRFQHREFMLDTFDVQNQIFDQQKTTYISAQQLVALGRDVNHWASSSTPKLLRSGDVRVEDGASLRLQSEGSVHFAPGFSVQEGGQLESSIVSSVSGCPSTHPYRISDPAENVIATPELETWVFDGRLTANIRNIYLPAKDSDYEWTLTGLETFRSGIGPHFRLDGIAPGYYTLSCSLFGNVQSNSTIIHVENYAHKEHKEVRSYTPTTGFAIYPNPTENTLMWMDNQAYDVSVYDQSGRLVLYSEAVKSVDLSNLPSGAYAVVLHSKTTGLNHKEIVIKE